MSSLKQSFPQNLVKLWREPSPYGAPGAENVVPFNLECIDLVHFERKIKSCVTVY